jgi:hypothetical protein
MRSQYVRKYTTLHTLFNRNHLHRENEYVVEMCVSVCWMLVCVLVYVYVYICV